MPKPTNRGQTGLKTTRRSADPMREFDQLPGPVRRWLADAILPWSPRSARRAYARALSRTRCPDLALAELDRMQASRLSAQTLAPEIPAAR